MFSFSDSVCDSIAYDALKESSTSLRLIYSFAPTMQFSLDCKSRSRELNECSALLGNSVGLMLIDALTICFSLTFN